MPGGETSSGGAGGAAVSVLVPLPLAATYDYHVPEGLAVAPGDFVAVPLGARKVVGVVWGPAKGAVAPERLKHVARVLDAPPLPGPLRRFVDWVATYTLAPPGAVLRMAMSVPEALAPPRPRLAYTLGGAAPERTTPARRRALALLADGVAREAGAIAREAGVGPSVVRGLVNAGVLAPVVLPPPPPARPDGRRAGPKLSPPQAAAAADLAAKVAAGRFSVTLLDGVTGSGKTEVYFEAIAAALAADRQVLVLLPEIALGAQWFQRFAARFGAEAMPWHSDLTRSQRRRVWGAVAEAKAPVVMGARSALFLPFRRLGLIVVDEEHDASYKQEEGVVYNARDMAVVRARLEGVPAVLCSATPSLETVINAQTRRYAQLNLPERHGGARLPEIGAVDMRRDGPERGRWLSPRLKGALEATVAAGEQAMLFLNRRGYAPLTLCRACGHRLSCPNCSAWLVEHRYLKRLLCHHCGHTAARSEACPACGATDRFAACGPGVERLAEEVAETLPHVRFAVMASDTVPGPAAAAELVRRVSQREVDLLIGTQIIAKGHHFPLLTLVGVADADLGLAGGDLRAAERTYQVLEQVAGRAGRAGRPGRVFLQTYMPEHPVMQALIAGDRQGFLRHEAAARRERGLPPFGRLAALVVSGTVEEEVEAAARALGRGAPSGPRVEVLGPAPAPLSLLRGRHRRRLLVKAARQVDLQKLLRAWLAAVRVPGRVRVQVDVDPYSFL
ncbi:MAG: primosomal protein N' [Alphaproteobacteria bacterium]